MRKIGIVPVDYVISFVFFMSMVVVVMFYAGHITGSRGLGNAAEDYAIQLDKSSSELENAFDMYLVPVYIDSAGDIDNYVFNLSFNPGQSANTDSIAVLDSTGNDISSRYNTSVFFQSDLKQGDNLFYIVYSTAQHFTEVSYISDINTSTAWVNTSVVSINFTGSGISAMLFEGEDLVDNAISFGDTSAFSIENLSVLSVIYYDNTTVSIHQNASRIIIENRAPMNVTLNLTDSFDYFYNTSVNQFNESVYEMFSFNIDFLDLYSTARGLSVIGDNLSVVLENYVIPSRKTISLVDVTSFEIYLHNSNYTQALDEKMTYLNPPGVLIGSAEALEDISVGRFDIFKYNDSQNRTLIGIPKIDFYLERM